MALRAADLQALLREFPHLSKSDLEEIGKELRKGVRRRRVRRGTVGGVATPLSISGYRREH